MSDVPTHPLPPFVQPQIPGLTSHWKGGPQVLPPTHCPDTQWNPAPSVVQFVQLPPQFVSLSIPQPVVGQHLLSVGSQQTALHVKVVHGGGPPPSLAVVDTQWLNVVLPGIVSQWVPTPHGVHALVQWSLSGRRHSLPH